MYVHTYVPTVCGETVVGDMGPFISGVKYKVFLKFRGVHEIL